MREILKDYIRNCGELDCLKYHEVIVLFGKDMVHNEINSYIKELIDSDFSYDNQCLLWKRFGYYLATLDNNVFIKQAISMITSSNDSRLFRKKRGGLSLEDEKRYGYHMLCRDYITICLDDKKNEVDMLKVFASIQSIEVRDLIIKRFDKFYNNISRVSDYDTRMKKFLYDYKKKCFFNDLPEIKYDGEILDNDVLLEQIDMYIRYSIAKYKYIKGNMDLVNYICRQFVGNSSLEIVGEGYLGLFNAIMKFDIRKGYVFSTYATRGIKLFIWSYQNNCSRLIRLPANMEILIYKLEEFNNNFYQKYGREPNMDEYKKEFGISENRVSEILYWIDRSNYFSLNKEYVKDDDNNSDDLEVMDIIADRNNYDIERFIDNNYMEYIYNLLDTRLNDREKYILYKYYSGNTLDSISNELGISRERVSQINRESLRKIRRISGIKEVNPFNI